MYLHKDGIQLRKVRQSDLPDLLKLKCESWWGTHKTTIINECDQQKWFESIPNDQLFLVGLKNFTSVGVAVYTEIDWISRTLKISGSIYKEQRTPEIVYSGFCAGLDFAFEILNMHRVEAEVLSYHVSAQNLEIKQLGFKVEGCKRLAVYKCGRYYDSVVLGMLREEWESCNRVKSYGDTCNKNFSHDYFSGLQKNLK